MVHFGGYADSLFAKSSTCAGPHIGLFHCTQRAGKKGAMVRYSANSINETRSAKVGLRVMVCRQADLQASKSDVSVFLCVHVHV